MMIQELLLNIIFMLSISRLSRGFCGILHPVDWEGRPGPCLYAGNRQAGSFHEIDSALDDGVIEGYYQMYRVNNAFSEAHYRFSLFNESQCITPKISRQKFFGA